MLLERQVPVIENFSNSIILNWTRILEKHDINADLQKSNPNYKSGIEWQVNCQRCVPTYEMRRRGYNVTALPANRYSSNYLSYYPFNVWENAKVKNCSGTGYEQIKDKMREWGDGSRAQIVVNWNNTNSGHTFIAEQVFGKTKFIDPQTGENDVSYYFDSVADGKTRFCRIDNTEVSSRIVDCCEEVKNDKF